MSKIFAQDTDYLFLIEQAVKSATLSRSVLVDAVKEAASAKAGLQVQTKAQDTAMTG